MGVRYAFGDEVPGLGEAREVAEGVYWVRTPLPFALDHLNVWVLRDGDGWTVVDTGLRYPACEEVWERVFSGLLKEGRVKKVVATHMHPDHIGMAGWLTRRCGAMFYMTREEYFMGRVLVADTGRSAPEAALGFYRRAGADAEALELVRRRFGSYGQYVSRMPESFRRLREGDVLEVDGREWRVWVGRGHSPEHACLARDDGVWLTGDQVLPRISSIVGVYPQEPEADPLKDWLESCGKFGEMMGDEVLSAPAHGAPFYGARGRLADLGALHESRLDAVCKRLKERGGGVKASDLFADLFRRPVGLESFTMAASESVAHLHCLRGRGEVEREEGSCGADLWSLV